MQSSVRQGFESRQGSDGVNSRNRGKRRRRNPQAMETRETGNESAKPEGEARQGSSRRAQTVQAGGAIGREQSRAEPVEWKAKSSTGAGRRRKAKAGSRQGRAGSSDGDQGSRGVSVIRRRRKPQAKSRANTEKRVTRWTRSGVDWRRRASRQRKLQGSQARKIEGREAVSSRTEPGQG